MRPDCALPRANPGRSACSKNAFSTAGMSPSHSGKMMRRCPAQRMVSCASAIASGVGPCCHSAVVRSRGNCSFATSMFLTS